jgi:hypothetical protein
MTEVVVTAGTADDYLVSGDDVSYANARAGIGSVLSLNGDANTLHISQKLDAGPSWYVRESFLAFDTSVVGAGRVVDSVVFSPRGESSGSPGSGWTCEARIYNWGADVSIADWVPGANLSACTLVASMPIASYADGTYVDWTSEVAFKAAINMTGTTYLVLCHSKTTTGTTPEAVEEVYFWSANKGAGYEPKLTINHSASGFTGVTVTKLLNG